MIYVVDDDMAVRHSLTILLGNLGHEVLAFNSAQHLLDRVDAGAQGCIVTDFRMPGMDGLALLAALRDRAVQMPVVLVTGHADVKLAVRAMKAGIVDLVEKPYSAPALLAVVEDALLRDSARPIVSDAAGLRVDALSPRERQVLVGLVGGQSNKAMGQALGISPRTVEIHRAHVMEKLGCRSLAEAVRTGLAAGLEMEAFTGPDIQGDGQAAGPQV